MKKRFFSPPTAASQVKINTKIGHHNTTKSQNQQMMVSHKPYLGIGPNLFYICEVICRSIC